MMVATVVAVHEISMKIFCINLKESIDRRNIFHKNWVDELGFDINYFDAINKNLIPESDIQRGELELDNLSFSPYVTYYNTAYNLRGIMACSLSHYSLLKSIKEEVDDDGVIVLEDDVIPSEGADKIKERICLARKYSPQVEAIICNKFIKPRNMYGLQIIKDTILKKDIFWDESIHAIPVDNSQSSIVKISPPGSFFMWYSREGVSRMIKLIEGREFISVDVFYGAFAQRGILSILTPGVGYHPSSNISTITTKPYITHDAK